MFGSSLARLIKDVMDVGGFELDRLRMLVQYSQGLA